MTNQPTLRERCIEAGAKAIANDRAEGPVTFAHLDDAEAAFDAILGVLTEHAHEMVSNARREKWRVEDAIAEGLSDGGEFESVEAAVLGALAVLGGDE